MTSKDGSDILADRCDPNALKVCNIMLHICLLICWDNFLCLSAHCVFSISFWMMLLLTMNAFAGAFTEDDIGSSC